MRLNKMVFYFALAISIVSVSISIFFTFFISNDITAFISNVLLNIFAGTIVLLATSLFDYYLQRRKLLTAIMEAILKYRNIFSKIKFLDLIDKIPIYEECKEYYNNQQNKIEFTQRDYEKQKKKSINKIKENMEKIMDTYIEISYINFSEAWLLWDELYFLKPFDRNKKRKWFYEEIFGYIYNLLNDIKEQAFHFNIYKNEFQNFEVNYEKIVELQKKIFYYEERDAGDYNWNYEVEEFDIRSYADNPINKKHCIVINNIEKHLSKMFVEVGKINYYNKKYDGTAKS
ncbi:MAG: hypothetical protein PHN72_00360 [Bacilli bacterium]|nr:hypothetical protein [Bacilli bacterium]